MSYMAADQIGRPTLVIAPTHEDYALWCRTTGTSRRTAEYVSGPESLFGRGRSNIIELGYPLWWTDEDTAQLDEIRKLSEK